MRRQIGEKLLDTTIYGKHGQTEGRKAALRDSAGALAPGSVSLLADPEYA